MTTIAYRNGILASDTGTCCGGSMFGHINKIARRENGDMAGAAGGAAYNYAFIEWFKAGEIGSIPEAMETQDSYDRGVIFRSSGEIEVYEPRGKFVVTADYYALGSGRAEAIGAMHAGADAEGAVRAAIEHDPHSGGRIVVLRASE